MKLEKFLQRLNLTWLLRWTGGSWAGYRETVVIHEIKAPDGLQLSAESLGHPDGTPVFLFHGTPGGLRGPRPRGPLLYRLGIRLISYDRPGYPGSSRRQGRTVANAAQDVEVIAHYFDIDRFSVVGRSGGAPHALACAALMPERVICAAALGSLAPYGAKDLDWPAGMAKSNVEAFRLAQTDEEALVVLLKEQASQVQTNSEGLLKLLGPELVGQDQEVIGDISLREIIANVHTIALRDSVDGWVDDVIALSKSWGFDPATITVPVKLWGGENDVFSPISHTYWLAEQITNARTEIGTAHFGTVEILPRILTWVAATANAKEPAGHSVPAVGNGIRPPDPLAGGAIVKVNAAR